MWKRQKGGIGGDSEGHQELGPHLSGHPLVQGLPETVSPSRPEPEKNLFFFFFHRVCSLLAWEVAGKRRWEEWGRALWLLDGGGDAGGC